MTPEQAFLTVLEPIEGLRDNIYPAEALKNAAAPFVFYLQRAEDETEALDGPTGLMSATYEIHCVAQTYAKLVWLAGQVRPALHSMQGRTFDGLLVERVTVRQASPDLKEVEVGLFRRALSLTMHYQKEDVT